MENTKQKNIHSSSKRVTSYTKAMKIRKEVMETYYNV
jgi:hypothetical protein